MPKELENINTVIIGHVDTGKSTLCGQLLARHGKIDKRTLEKYEKESNEMGKGSFKYAWVMDNLKAERERGITINNSLNELFTKNRKITIIDAPGHRDFIKNMISGTSQADAAILMVSGNKGEFEAGISKEGQTNEHALLAHTLGIKHVVACVNKMDLTMESGDKVFNEQRFEEVKGHLEDLFKKIGFNKKRYWIIPISGFHGDNVATRSDRCPWYKGKILSEILDELPVPKRPTDKPLRVPIQQKYKIAGIGTVTSGRVESGTMKAGMMLHFAPGNFKSECKSIEAHHSPVEEAIPGMNVGFSFKGIDFKTIHKGMVVGDAKNNPPTTNLKFKAQVLNLRRKGELNIGYTPVIHIHAANVACKMVAIESTFDKRSGKEIAKNPKSIKKNEGAIVEFEPSKKICVEKYSVCGPLGRFCARDGRDTVLVGLVKETTNENPAEKK